MPGRQTDARCEWKPGSSFRGVPSIDLVKESDVKGEAKRVLHANLLGELQTKFFGRSGRVSEERLGAAIHESDGEHEWLLGLGGLRNPTEKEPDTCNVEAKQANFTLGKKSTVGGLPVARAKMAAAVWFRSSLSV